MLLNSEIFVQGGGGGTKKYLDNDYTLKDIEKTSRDWILSYQVWHIAPETFWMDDLGVTVSYVLKSCI